MSSAAAIAWMRSTLGATRPASQREITDWPTPTRAASWLADVAAGSGGAKIGPEIEATIGCHIDTINRLTAPVRCSMDDLSVSWITLSPSRAQCT